MVTHMGKHVIELAKKDTRLDGRAFDEYRNVTVEVGNNGNADGFARVRLGDTEVLAGIKMEVGTPYPDTPEDGALMVGAELLPMSNPKYESGPPGIDSIELARVVDRGIRESKTIDTKKLCIEPGEKVWMVSIDLIPMNSDGNLFDAAALAAIAALKNTKFPVMENGVVNPREKTNEPLPVSKTPIAVTIHKIAGKLVVDPLEDEEEASEARLTVATVDDTEICAMQKGGDSALSTEELSAMIDLAFAKAKELRAKLEG